ncbi:MAG: S26 family signal peptidase, partial [Actinomycetota bacterium]
MTQARLRRAVDLVGAMRSSQPVLRRRLGAMLAVVASVYVGSTAMVVSSASLPVLLAGWEPVVITTESARPALSPGDLVLFDELHVAETVDEGSVVRFRDPDNPAHTVVDRVAGRQDDTYVILGDGSPTRRGAAVGRDAILGVDRLSLPIVGLPVVWLEDGDLAPFAMWAISIVGATAFLVHRWQRRALRPRRRGGRAGDVADSAIRRLRAGVGVLVIVQLAVDDSPLRSGADAVAAVAVVVALGTINVASMRAWRPRIRRYLELAVDVVVALLIAAPAGSGSLLWLALLLPIAEATIRARVVGAAVAWMSLALASVVLRTATAPDGDTVADQLGGLVEQLGVLLVATLFGAFLTEKLLVGIVSQRDAVQRSELLHVVAEAGQRVSTVDLELMTTVLETTESLGFDRCDVVVRSDEAWRVVGASSGGTWGAAATTAAGGGRGARRPPPAAGDDAPPHP